MVIVYLASLFFLVSILPNIIRSQINDSYYDLCKPFHCSNITFTFPFSLGSNFDFGSRQCGLPGYQIFCESSANPRLLLSDRLYQVKQLYQQPESDNKTSYFVTVVPHPMITDLSSGSCVSLGNLSISTSDVAPLQFPSWGVNLTLFQCPSGLTLSQDFLHTLVNNFSYNCQYGDGDELHLWREVNGNESQINPVLVPSGCKVVLLPVSRASLSSYGLLNSSDGDSKMVLKAQMGMEQLLLVLRDGFPLEWPRVGVCENCWNKGGRCGYNSDLGKVECFCEDGHCQPFRHKQSKWKLVIGVATMSSFILLAVVLLSIFKYKKRIPSTFKTSHSRKSETGEDRRDADQFIKEYRSTILTNYSYNDLEKMTDGFQDKLGEGGFGSVYKGKLLDGRLIAVKMLVKSNHDNHQDFVNEVGTIGRIHHVNVIRLLGFCWDGSKQALIYEYMPNGSLRDLLSREGARLSLDLAGLLEIAMGVAHGIEYLHNGCESRILHLDIKPQNILLDQNLNPKISDFGLAKVYSRDRSAVSMTCARGTIGYIAPEIFMRTVGNPSHKSDVYSYGMLLLDMVGRKKEVVSKINSSNESYFPDWIYDELREEEGMEAIDSVVEDEMSIAKKMIMVGVWCIQIDPRDRPSMIRVVEMLNGSAEAIEMPPKPLFSSPRAHFEQETTYADGDTGATFTSFHTSRGSS